LIPNMAKPSSPSPETVLREQKDEAEECSKMDVPEVMQSVLTAPSPARCRKLEPSLQAWAASNRAAAQLPNVAASEERGRERYSRHDWMGSLRQETQGSQTWGKQFHPTVPRGPHLRTEDRSRSRSRSCSSSREWTPQNTPTRHSLSRSMTPGRGMPVKEQEAVDQYLNRMALARLDSPLRKIAFGSGTPRVAASPARSASGSSHTGSDYSRDSRLSHLSRPRSLSKDQLSTEDRECLKAAEERRALRKQLRRNRRKYKEALLGGNIAERCTERILTTPIAPELHTSFRGARLRSTSWHGTEQRDSMSTAAGADSRVYLKKHPNPREQAAIERHLEHRFAALLLANPFPVKDSARETPVPGPVRKPEQQAMSIPKGVEADAWIAAAESPEERAQRARAVALARRDTEWEEQRSQLCIFRPSTGGMPATPEKAVGDLRATLAGSPRSPEANQASADTCEDAEQP